MVIFCLSCRDEVILIERIEALELLGATFVDKKRDMAGAIKYWKRALELRYEIEYLICNILHADYMLCCAIYITIYFILILYSLMFFEIK